MTYLNWTSVRGSAEQNACYQITTINTTVPATGKSDGLVTEGSAKQPGACEIEVEGVNHWELLNHENTTMKYNGILDGNLCGPETGLFFQTD